jgi:hypothetical protein
MKLNEINNTFQHQITGGSDYGWDCYGSNTWSIEYTSKYAHGYVIFDTVTQKVYEVNVSPAFGAWGTDEHEPKPYRYIDPDYRVSHDTEAKDRNIDSNQAWDDTNWVDLETEEDFIDKASKMFVGETFDTRIVVPLDLDNETIIQLSMEAHKRDITLNQMVEELLKKMISEHEFNIA